MRRATWSTRKSGDNPVLSLCRRDRGPERGSPGYGCKGSVHGNTQSISCQQLRSRAGSWRTTYAVDRLCFDGALRGESPPLNQMMSLPQQSTSWNDTIRKLPYAHILQTEEWGRFKQRTTGWNYEKTCLTDPSGQ